MGAQWKAKPKEAAANARGKIFGKLVKEIMVAARNGADPDMNPRLRLAVHQAKKASMPKDTLERAIKKGSGQSGEVVNFERTLYEGFAPHRVPLIVECLTDNINRTVAEIRVLFPQGPDGRRRLRGLGLRSPRHDRGRSDRRRFRRRTGCHRSRRPGLRSRR